MEHLFTNLSSSSTKNFIFQDCDSSKTTWYIILQHNEHILSEINVNFKNDYVGRRLIKEDIKMSYAIAWQREITLVNTHVRVFLQDEQMH